MNIAVIGGTGLLGRHVAQELKARNHQVRVMSRHHAEYQVDLTTGEGLGIALAGCDAIVDASNATGKAVETLIQGSRRLLIAGKEAGVSHHVGISIVGCERVPINYYKAKTNQEQVIKEGSVPWSIVRATQFHEFVANLFAQAARWGVLPIPGIPVQTVAVSEVARYIADVVESGPHCDCLEIAGPEIIDARRMARAWKTMTGRNALVLPLPLPGSIGTPLRAGAATNIRPHRQGTIRFTEWLQQMTNGQHTETG